MPADILKNPAVKCPCCRVDYPVEDAFPAIKEPLFKSYVLYALCPECNQQYGSTNEAGKKDLAHHCFENFKIYGKDPSGEMYPWSVTTEIALHTNGYEIDKALINGQNIPREIYNLIEHGEIKIQCLPTNLYGMQPLTLVLD
jgi:hypothetical protein